MWESGLDGLPFQLQAYLSETCASNTPIFSTWAIRSQWLWSLLSLSIFWVKRWEIKTVSFLTRLLNFLVPWRSVNWFNGWSREIFLVEIIGKFAQKNKEVQNYCDIEEIVMGIVSMILWTRKGRIGR